MDKLHELERELAQAQQRRERKELSDDYCYTNGSIQPYLDEERRLVRKIKALREQNAKRQGEFAL